MKKKLLLLVVFVLTGCSITNNFMDYYEPEENIVLTKKIGDTDVTVIETADFQEKIKSYTDKGYVVIGTSLLKGIWEPRVNAVRTAQKFGATVVITHSVPVEKSTSIHSTSVPQVNVGMYANGKNMTVASNVSTGTVIQSTTNVIFEQRAAFLALKREDNQ